MSRPARFAALLGMRTSNPTHLAADQAATNGNAWVHGPYRTTRAPPPAICLSTSCRVAIEVSPGVVEASAP